MVAKSMLPGHSPDHPVMISNAKYWMVPHIIAACVMLIAVCGEMSEPPAGVFWPR